MAANAGMCYAETEQQVLLVSPFTLTSVQENLSCRSTCYFLSQCLTGLSSVTSSTLMLHQTHLSLSLRITAAAELSFHCFPVRFESLSVFWRPPGLCGRHRVGAGMKRRHEVLRLQRLISHLNCVEDKTCATRCKLCS